MERGISVKEGYVRAEIGERGIDHGLTALRLLVLACETALCSRALVLAQASDLAPHLSITRGVEELTTWRFARSFRLALVAAAPAVLELYSAAAQTAAAQGIAAMAFAAEDDAVRWLRTA